MHTIEQIDELMKKINDICIECPRNSDEDCDCCAVRQLADQLYAEGNPITANDIKRGLLCGIVRLISEDGVTVCKIGGMGGNWFYFGGTTAEEETPYEYATHMDFDEIVLDIVDAIEGFRESDPDEWWFYRYTLDNQ